MVRLGLAYHPGETYKILIFLLQAVIMGRYVLVRVRGLEPPLSCLKQILSLPRLPFRHTRTRPECACSTGPRQGAQPPRRLWLSLGLVDGAERSAEHAGKDGPGGLP